MVASEVTSVPKNTQKPPNFKRLLVPKRAHLHWAQDQGAPLALFRIFIRFGSLTLPKVTIMKIRKEGNWKIFLESLVPPIFACI